MDDFKLDNIIDAYKSNNTEKLNNYFTNGIAIEYHVVAQAWDNNNFRDYVFSRMMDNLDNVNPHYILLWAVEIESHKEELFEIILSWTSPHFFNEKYIYDLMVAHWLLDVNYKNSDIKIKAISEDLVDYLMEALINISQSMPSKYPAYYYNDFYSDLPIDYQLGIIL